jgi:putative transposon-encoded protein
VNYYYVLHKNIPVTRVLSAAGIQSAEKLEDADIEKLSKEDHVNVLYSSKLTPEAIALEIAVSRFPCSVGLRDANTVLKAESEYVFNGVTYQTDAESRINIVSKALQLQLDDTLDVVYWKAKDNTVNEFTRDEFIVFAKEVAVYYESLVLKTYNSAST